jgi:membrane carboxypeptidase/penicillin-binding protein PbpC
MSEFFDRVRESIKECEWDLTAAEQKILAVLERKPTKDELQQLRSAMKMAQGLAFEEALLEGMTFGKTARECYTEQEIRAIAARFRIQPRD